MTIEEFKGEYRWLSNFSPVTIMYKGITYGCTEAAYQAHKSTDPEVHEIFSYYNGQKSKRAGRKLQVRSDWDDVKIGVMEDLQRLKYQNPELKTKLLATGNCMIIEGNYWKDTFWGVCDGIGHNHLGKIIMSIRKELLGGER